MSWWHLDTPTLEWRGGGLYRSNYDSRVCACVWFSNYGDLPKDDLHRRHAATPPCSPATNLTSPKVVVTGHGSFVGYDNDEDIVMTDHQHYRHLSVTGRGGGRLRFYGLNLEHAMR